MVLVENNEPLYIPTSKKWNGLTVYCNRCKTNVSDLCKDTGKPIQRCAFGDKHVFKVTGYVPGATNERKTKKLETREVDEAIREAIDFIKEIKQSKYQKRNSEREDVSTTTVADGELLIYVMDSYVDWLNNVGLPKSLVVERSKDHIDDIKRTYAFFVKCLKNWKINIETFYINEIDQNVVGKLADAMKEKGLSNRTINKQMTYLTSCVKWYSEQTGLPVRNFFKQYRLPTSYRPKQFPREEFEQLLNQITPENGIGYDNGKKPRRNYYHSWLPFAFRLALITGRRREELTTMKWSDIKEVNGELYIQVEDIKVNRIKKRLDEAQKKYNPTPVNPELMELLTEMGYEKYRGTDNYILAPEVKMSRGKAMCNILSRSFAHYYKQLNTGKQLTFKSFRKTNFTELQLKFGDNARFISGHTSTNILGTRYVDHSAIALRALEMVKNEKEASRQDELNKLRKESNENEHQKEINR